MALGKGQQYQTMQDMVHQNSSPFQVEKLMCSNKALEKVYAELHFTLEISESYPSAVTQTRDIVIIHIILELPGALVVDRGV